MVLRGILLTDNDQVKTALSCLLFFFLLASCDRLDSSAVSWSELDAPTDFDLNEILIKSDGSWHAVGGETWEIGIYVESQDEGLSWQIEELHNKALFSLAFDESQNLYSTGISSFLYVQEADDEKWLAGNPIIWATGRDVAFANENRGILVGGEALINGHLVVYGENYEAVEKQHWDREISTVCYTDEDTWFVAGFGFIAKSENGGMDWQMNEFAGDFFVDLFFVDELVGYCIGNSGTIAKTTDGGENWNSQRNGSDLFTSDLAFRALFFKDANQGFICGEDGLLIYTENGGGAWKRAEGLPEVDYNDVVYADDFGLLVGEDGRLVSFSIE